MSIPVGPDVPGRLVTRRPSEPSAGAGTATGPSARQAPAADHRPPWRLVHRPATASAVADGHAPREHHFVLSRHLPLDDRLFGDTAGRFHDPQIVVDAMHRGSLFAARHYLDVPADRVPLSTATGISVLSLAAWRRGGLRSAATELRVRGVAGADGRVGALECDAVVSIDGTPCATGHTRIALLPAPVDGCDGPAGAPGPPAWLPRRRPEDVGRTDPRNVVVSGPLPSAGGTVLLDVRVGSQPPAAYRDRVPYASTVLLTEAMRQSAVTAAVRLRALRPSLCVLTRWDAEFTERVPLDRPTHCWATPGRAGRDGHGRRVVGVTLRLTSDGRDAGTAQAVLVECR
jgi:A-factor biosynthesis hotdog domain